MWACPSTARPRAGRTRVTRQNGPSTLLSCARMLLDYERTCRNQSDGLKPKFPAQKVGGSATKNLPSLLVVLRRNRVGGGDRRKRTTGEGLKSSPFLKPPSFGPNPEQSLGGSCFASDRHGGPHDQSDSTPRSPAGGIARELPNHSCATPRPSAMIPGAIAIGRRKPTSITACRGIGISATAQPPGKRLAPT